MKIVIPTKGRALTIKSHLMLKKAGVPFKIIVHNQEEYDKYIQNPTIQKEDLVISGQPYCVSAQRQWILENLIDEGEWFLTLDDNVVGFTGVPEELSDRETLPVEEDKELSKEYYKDLSVERFLKICDEMIKKSDQEQIYYCGFAVVDNFYFRGKKYRNVGYVISKVALIKKTKLINYDQKVMATDDYAYTAENLKIFGKVLINNYVFPTAGHYEEGGIGNYEQRVNKKIVDCEYMMKKYPGLFRYKIKADCHPKAEVQINFTNLEQVEAWRESLKIGSHKYW